MQRTPAAAALWEEVYPSLTHDHPGLVGKLLARAEAHVARLSALFALFAQAPEIDVEHLQSALALWEYVEASTRAIFGDRTGNDVADRIVEDMAPGERLTKTEIREEIFKGHVRARHLSDALALLVQLGEVRIDHEKTGGRNSAVVTRLDRTGGTEGGPSGSEPSKEPSA